MPKLDRRQPLHFIGAGGIGMSALAGILAERGFLVSGSDPRPSPVLERLRTAGVRVFQEQTAATIAAVMAGLEETQGGAESALLVVISSAVPAANEELAEARRRGLAIVHRSDVLAALINDQPSIAVAGSHGKTTTSTLIATLLEAVGEDPTAVIGGIVPAFGSNGRHGQGLLLVAEADESDGSLVKFTPRLGLLTNVELDHTDHYLDLASLVATLQRFASGCTTLLANRDCPVLHEHFEATSWWSTRSGEAVEFAAIPLEERGDGTLATWYEHGVSLGTLEVPLPGRHNLSNTVAAMAACRLEGVPFADLRQAVASLRPPGRRFDCRGLWQDRAIVDDYAHHPSEVAATLAMARLMVESGRSPLPLVPRRLVAVFQPHRYTRTAQFLDDFAAALTHADAVLLAPLYAAGEAPMAGISSPALAEALRALAPDLPVAVAASMEALAELVSSSTGPGDLVLAMGAGDINSLWERLGAFDEREHPSALVA
ncbi:MULTISPECIES: UDP-N-acetylmuramate--L-alanine ligase [unclassified Cyanobium]|uniref:UDP-N-acetylmuramate--L-alanine ligase n=1 Tax=unclassified Cyanobium TaxID=2627006 RepID=UPI0020CF49E5|nr:MULTISPECIES: UDP-N-acetylmuramate--L-alanine ligase [unclassified Cyanobium]MCP9857902.1 UDP-N-acetylmuramate--L-alanine ligase [Cyanobium sp. Cruz-8H5]MCP9865041.1 UDP-N-acetylmuramate--L-alanine ligase [Cyanobium sp. Cruz-8D1]